MEAFVFNRHGRIVFPSNFFPELGFSVFETVQQFEAVIRRDFEAKAPTGTDILERVESGRYEGRYELLRDLALHLLWTNRFAITMYEKRPTRWRDVPRKRDDFFLPILTPWEDAERKIAAVENAYGLLPASWDAESENRIFAILFDIFRHKLYHATELPAIKPTVSEFAADPQNLTYCISGYSPDYPVFGVQQIIDCTSEVPELESLERQAMVLHDQYPWDRAATRLAGSEEIGDDDVVVVFHPRSPSVLEFIRRAKARRPPRPRPPAPRESRKPIRPLDPVIVANHFTVMPRLESLAVARGEHLCTNDDVIRNGAYNWSPMTAQEIARKTGIEARVYTEQDLEHISLAAAEAALAGAGRGAEEIGAVLFCSCTSSRLIPSVATWLSGQLGIYQTHASVDLVAACAGMPYGLAEAIRQLQEVRRPVLVVFAEKFSDKIGSVRTSRMIFGDGAAAMVVGIAPDGARPDVEVVQTYASGPASEVNSIIWPNPEFDNNITVYGPEVKALARRYLVQMIEELRTLPHPDSAHGSLLDSIELVVPHQANKTMVTELAVAAGLAPDHLYFNIERVGNISSASIPIAIYDSVREGVIDRRKRVFAPGFGAGAVGGYVVLHIDPDLVVPEREPARGSVAISGDPRVPSSDDVRVAFGE